MMIFLSCLLPLRTTIHNDIFIVLAPFKNKDWSYITYKNDLLQLFFIFYVFQKLLFDCLSEEIKSNHLGSYLHFSSSGSSIIFSFSWFLIILMIFSIYLDYWSSCVVSESFEPDLSQSLQPGVNLLGFLIFWIKLLSVPVSSL